MDLPSTRRREVGEARDEYMMMCRAMSLIYFAITLLVSWLFYTLMTRNDAK